MTRGDEPDDSGGGVFELQEPNPAVHGVEPHPSEPEPPEPHEPESPEQGMFFGRQVRIDVRARLEYYSQDWRDTCVAGRHLAGPTVYTFMASVLPALAFGMELDDKTDSQLGISHVLVVTAFAGLAQSFLGGQPLLIIGVAEPIVVMYGFLYTLCEDSDDIGQRLFLPFCGWVCIWAGLMCILLALFGATKLIIYFTLFAGEIFGGLIAVLFMQQAILGTVHEFTELSSVMGTINGLWAVLVVCGMPVTIFYFQRLGSSRLLNSSLRYTAQYAPLIMVILFTCLSYTLGPATYKDMPHRVTVKQPWDEGGWDVAKKLGDVPVNGIFLAMGPGAAIAVLFFFDHTVSSQLAQTGDDVRVERPPSYAWDLLLLGVLTIICGLIGLPPINGVIPQAPFHSRALRGIKQLIAAEKGETTGCPDDAQQEPDSPVSPRSPTSPGKGRNAEKRFRQADVDGNGTLDREEWISKYGNADGFDTVASEDGVVKLETYIASEVDVMEQRGSNLIQALMVGVCAMAAPVIEQIPSSVLWGYFAFMSLESIPDFQLSNRIVLLFTETSGREKQMEGMPYATVPFEPIVWFTLMQILCIAGVWALIVFGGMAGMAFPVPILLLLPLRSHLLPRWFGKETIQMLDAAEYEEEQEAADCSAAAMTADVETGEPDGNVELEPAAEAQPVAEAESAAVGEEVTAEAQEEQPAKADEAAAKAKAAQLATAQEAAAAKEPLPTAEESSVAEVSPEEHATTIAQVAPAE